ncbi:MAG: glycine--tRNA ligase subunit beta, partial [Rhodospirillales bacterium]|nr:glycine--tRNA ligase subunit beta [Rhodospirillales bacterium]
MAELLIELFSEEIPARMQGRATDDLKRLVCEGLKGAGLEFTKAESYVTPRRLVLVIDGLPEASPDISEERRGPRADAPEKALQGFLGSTGLTLDQCEKRDTGKGEFWFAVIEKKGAKTAEILPGLLEKAFADLPWPKSMRWGSNDLRWVRPLHSILCLFGGAVVPLTFGPITSGDATRGHRFMAPGSFAVKDFADYRDRLRKAFVIIDPAERRTIIAEGAAKLAKAEGLTVREDEGLLNEVAGLVEWPVPLMGRIDDAFMAVPSEVLVTSMRAHQKYFSCLDANGKLASRFIVIANREGEGGNDAIVAGNERVLRARLSDARFFWDQDHKQPLEALAPRLADMVFHAKLGTTSDKVTRIGALAQALCAFIPGADKAKAARAAELCKADLVSGMVGEFPEVQGIMGRYYALDGGEDANVANAIAEHYAPQGPNDDCPTAPVSVALALADKIDTLVGFWTIDEKPTGSKDPFALRRAA